MVSRVQEKKDTANEKCQQAINLNITNSNNIIMSGMVSKMQDKERGEAARKKTNSQYQHCQQYHQNLVTCGVKGAR